MKNPENNILKKAYAILMISLISMMVLNSTIFQHTHKTIDGLSISHAHPYNKTTDNAPIKSHHHTSFEFSIINTIGILFTCAFILIASLFGIKLKPKPAYIAILNTITPPLNLQGRAPPVSYIA